MGSTWLQAMARSLGVEIRDALHDYSILLWRRFLMSRVVARTVADLMRVDILAFSRDLGFERTKAVIYYVYSYSMTINDTLPCTLLSLPISQHLSVFSICLV